MSSLPDKQQTEVTDDELWDYYSGLPNPMWYQHIKEIKEDDEEKEKNEQPR